MKIYSLSYFVNINTIRNLYFVDITKIGFGSLNPVISHSTTLNADGSGLFMHVKYIGVSKQG